MDWLIDWLLSCMLSESEGLVSVVLLATTCTNFLWSLPLIVLASSSYPDAFLTFTCIIGLLASVKDTIQGWIRGMHDTSCCVSLS